MITLSQPKRAKILNTRTTWCSGKIMNTPTDILLSLARYKIAPTKSDISIKLKNINEEVINYR